MYRKKQNQNPTNNVEQVSIQKINKIAKFPKKAKISKLKKKNCERNVSKIEFYI